MEDIKSISGNPIVVGTSGIEDGAVTDAKLADDVIAHFDELRDGLGVLIGAELLKFSNGHFSTSSAITVPPSVSPDNDWLCAVSSCEAGDIIRIKGVGGNQYRLWAFYDSLGNRISMSGANASAPSPVRLVAPAGSAYLVTQSDIAQDNEPLCIKGRNVPDIEDDIDKRMDSIEKSQGYKKIKYFPNISQGTLSSTKGTLDSTNNNRVCTIAAIEYKDAISIFSSSVFDCAIFWYTDSTFDNFISSSGWLNGSSDILNGVTVPQGASFLRVAIKWAGTTSTPISPSDITENQFYVIDVSAFVTDEDVRIQSSYPIYIFMCRDSMASRDVPPNSYYAIKETARSGYDKVRFSVTKTTDGEYVAVHDVTINNLAVNTDGTPISGSVATADQSLEDLNEYDWGLKFGSEYAGLGVPMLNDCLRYAAMYNLSVALDFKWVNTFTQNDADAISNMLLKYGHSDAILIQLNPTNQNIFKAKCPSFSYWFGGTLADLQSQAERLTGLMTGRNNIYYSLRPQGELPTQEVISAVNSYGFDIMYSPIEGFNNLVSSVGFSNGIKLFECHYIDDIKKQLYRYVDSIGE